MNRASLHSPDTYPLPVAPLGAGLGRVLDVSRSKLLAFRRSFVACWKLFAGGGVWEFLLTIDLIVTAEKDVFAAGAMSALNTIAWGYFLYKIVDAKTRRKESIIWMAVGCAFGCMLGTWLMK